MCIRDSLQIRKLEKIKGTYLEAFVREQTDGFIHPFYNLHNVRTYRSSSADPNFQNIPKRDKESMKICRRAILPRPGHMLVEADFSALEVNIDVYKRQGVSPGREKLDGSSSVNISNWG